MGSCAVSPSSAVPSLSLQPPRDCQRTVVAACPWWPHGLYSSRASSHTRAGPRSDTTARVPSCPPCAISCHSRLNEPCPRLTSRRSAALLRCTGAPLSVRQRHRGRTERGARSVGSLCPTHGITGASHGLYCLSRLLCLQAGGAPAQSPGRHGTGAGKCGTMLVFSLPEFALYPLQRGAGLVPSAGLVLGGAGSIFLCQDLSTWGEHELETEPGAVVFLLPIAAAPATACPLWGPSRCSGDTG